MVACAAAGHSKFCRSKAMSERQQGKILQPRFCPLCAAWPRAKRNLFTVLIFGSLYQDKEQRAPRPAAEHDIPSCKVPTSLPHKKAIEDDLKITPQSSFSPPSAGKFRPKAGRTMVASSAGKGIANFAEAGP
jgi:hypothetical protein